MSMTYFSTQPTRTAAQEQDRLWHAMALARYSRRRREELDLTVEAAAQLAGLEVSEWTSLEEGWIPEDLRTLRSLAGALRVRWMDYHRLAFLAGCYRWC